jgi:hypothetical protein
MHDGIITLVGGFSTATCGEMSGRPSRHLPCSWLSEKTYHIVPIVRQGLSNIARIVEKNKRRAKHPGVMVRECTKALAHKCVSLTPLVIFRFRFRVLAAHCIEVRASATLRRYSMESSRLVCFTRLGSARGSAVVLSLIGQVKGEFETYIYLWLEFNSRHKQGES